MACEMITEHAARLLLWQENKMRYFLSTAMLLGMTVAAAAAEEVPEIDALAGATALSAVAAVAVLVWERRRR